MVRGKKFLIPLLLLVVGFIVVLVFIFLQKTNDDPDFSKPKNHTEQDIVESKSVCSNEILERANKLIKEDDSYNLADEAEKIKKLNDYDKDVNCLYVLIWDKFLHNMPDEDGLEEKLNRVFNSAEGFSDLFDDRLTLSDIRVRFVALKEINESYKKQQEDRKKKQEKVKEYL